MKTNFQNAINTIRYYWIHHAVIREKTLIDQFTAWLAHTDQDETAVQVGEYIVTRSKPYVRVYERLTGDEQQPLVSY